MKTLEICRTGEEGIQDIVCTWTCPQGAWYMYELSRSPARQWYAGYGDTKGVSTVRMQVPTGDLFYHISIQSIGMH
jgi:hypothetical protein